MITTATMATKNNSDNTILLVEDEPINQLVVGSLLKKAGYNYDLAENGQDAFQLASSHLYKLILMDIELPDMTGIEVTYKIRGNGEPQKHVPIVALTSHTDKKTKDQCFQSGMDGFANKPISQSDLGAIIHKYIKAD